MFPSIINSETPFTPLNLKQHILLHNRLIDCLTVCFKCDWCFSIIPFKCSFLLLQGHSSFQKTLFMFYLHLFFPVTVYQQNNNNNPRRTQSLKQNKENTPLSIFSAYSFIRLDSQVALT